MIDEIIDEVLEKEMRERKIGHYYVSEIPYCLRGLYYKYKYPRKTEAEKMRLFERGNILHEWLAQTLKKSDKIKMLFNERSIIIPLEGIFLRGRLDDFIVVEREQKKYVIEVKSTADISYTTDINDYHKMQIIPYLMIEECTGIVVYIDARYLTTKEFEMEFDWFIWKEIKQRTTDLHNFLISNLPPPKEAKTFPKRAWECNYCIYKEECDKI